MGKSNRMRDFIEPFRIKMVEPLKVTTEEYRKEALNKAHYNTFLLDAEDVFIDFLTDSGTGTMSDNQWSAMLLGDESYAGAKSWKHFESVAKELTGMPHILPTHQGRAAEKILYTLIGGEGKIFISNTHFDTTRANIEFNKSEAIDIVCEEGKDFESDYPFKGNIDLARLKDLIATHGAEKISAVIMTVTNNSAGGQPVSMENYKAVREICDKEGIFLVMDGCRIAENSYYVKHNEAGYEDKTYTEIAQEMLGMSDAFIMSSKKDGLVNIGGILALRDDDLYEKSKNMLILTEGFVTYGGLSGRDLEALAVGLKEVFEEDYLEYRIKHTRYLGEGLRKKGIPVIWPIGGHAVYVDAKALYPNIPLEQFPGQALACDLYVKGGIRTVEIGSVMFGKWNKDNEFVPALNELVRLAIPRRSYTKSHLDYVLDVFDDILEERNKDKGYKFTYEPPFLRHFTCHFEPVEK